MIINGPEPETLDPGLLTGQADGRIALALFEGLTRFNPTNAMAIPGLAERWEISDDFRTYTFHLRTTARWSTGEPILAADVVYSWQRAVDPRTGGNYASLLFYIRNAEAINTGAEKDLNKLGVTATDNHTVRVQLIDPTPFFLELCALPTLAVVPRQAIERFGDRWLRQQTVPCSGAYHLEFWRMNDRVRVRRNPHYWDVVNVQTDVVDMLTCTSPTTALNLFETGAADIIWDKELLPPELLDVLMGPKYAGRVHRYDYLAIYFARFNVTKPPLNDVRVRKALALATDKQRIVDKITRAGEKTAGHLVPAGVEGYRSPRGLGYDPARARALLAEAGFPEGRGFPPIHYMYNGQRMHEKIAVELQEMWRANLGIRVDLRQLEWKVFLSEQNNVRYDVSRSSWIGDYNDPNTFLDMFLSNSGNNRTGWRSERYDTLLRRGNAEGNPQRRAEILHEAERLLVEEDLPILPLYFYVGLECFDTNRVEGVHLNIRAEHPLWAIRRRAPVR